MQLLSPKEILPTLGLLVSRFMRKEQHKTALKRRLTLFG